MQNNIELLSPAGTWEALVAAVQNGADAVYLGGKNFNARQYAGNFDHENLKKAVDYCHVRGVKVYLTANTLISDAEMKAFGEDILYAYHIGVDAVIVQDIGAAKLVKEIAPGLSLHASTQMTVHNLEGVQVLQKAGFERAVLARELNEEEMASICKNTSMEIEVFVHGALCICYSGQCLMSSVIGGRSGNRGRCAQPCRLPYQLVDLETGKTITQDDGEKYLLSPKDLSLVEYIGRLRAIGVKSLKIEGRMKRPEYVAAVTGIYRKYLDSGHRVTPEDQNILLQVFNRGGFTQGYFTGQKGCSMMSYSRPKHWGLYIGDVVSYNRAKGRVTIQLNNTLHVGDGIEIWSKGKHATAKVTRLSQGGKIVERSEKGQAVSFSIQGEINKGDKVYKTYDVVLDEGLKRTFENNVENRKVPVYAHCRIALGKPIVLNVWDEDGNHVQFMGDTAAERAVHKALEREKVLKQLNKIGGTPFLFKDISIEMEPNLALAVSEINTARRETLAMLEQKRTERHGCKPLSIKDIQYYLKHIFENHEQQVKRNKMKISVQVSNASQAEGLFNGCIDRLYIPISWLADKTNTGKYEALVDRFVSQGVDVVCVLPKIFRQADRTIYEGWIKRLSHYKFSGVMLGNIGQIEMLGPDAPYDLFGDMGLNVFNSLAILYYQQLGLKGVTLSPELTFKQIEGLNTCEAVETEIIAYGRLPLMIMENCPISQCENCGGQKKYGLLDRKGMVFPVRVQENICRTEIYNSQPIFLADHMDDILRSRVDSIRLMFTDESPVACREITRLYSSALNAGQVSIIEQCSGFIESLKQQGFTRGHYYRGV